MVILLPNAPLHPEDSRSGFDAIFSTPGEIAKQASNRKTLRFIAQSRAFYLKTHEGIGWAEIFKNLLQFKTPVLGAEVEWTALHTVRALGINTVTPAGYGCQGINPAHQKSFLLTEDLGESVTLEFLLKHWTRQTQLTREDIRLKRALIRGTAQLARRLHSHSVIHRDLYLCHLRIRTTDLAHHAPALFLMDLHRTRVRTFRRNRWIIKDLGSLLFSVLQTGLSRTDRLRFIGEYSQKPLREELTGSSRWKHVEHRARRTAQQTRTTELSTA